MIIKAILSAAAILCFAAAGTSLKAQSDIVHDAEYYILEAYILIDDIGFGDLGSKTLNSIRGYSTPRRSTRSLVRACASRACTRSLPVRRRASPS